MTERLSDRAAAPPSLGARLDRLVGRLGVTGRFGRDAVLAVAVSLATLALFAVMGRAILAEPFPEVTAGQVQAVAVIAGAQSLLLCLRRVRPWLCLALVVASQTPIIAITPEINARAFAPLIAAYTVGTLTTGRLAAAAAAGAVVVEVGAAAAVMWAQDGSPGMVANHLGSSAAVYVAAVFVGLHVAARRRYVAAERERAAQAIASQRDRARAAVAAERTRIARELHDVAAHHLSGMVIQAAAVERLIDRDSESAKSGAAWIRSQGKATLANLRQVVGLLREHDGPGEDGNAPVPGLAAIEALVEDARRLGAEVGLEREGTPFRLPPIADISLYRIAQQSLTNARQHAPGAPVKVRLAYGERDVELEIVNGPSVQDDTVGVGSGGAGLVGMRERAELIGAELALGPTDDGGWRAALRLPVRGADRDRPGDSDFETGVRA
ncbi:sensor histidine kinase [Glycomyces tarimensis]